MSFFFCIPIFFGCPTRIKPEGDQTPRICPRCHNVSVVSAKSRTWFELCFVPLIPMSNTHIWICSVCNWHVPMQQGWEPHVPAAGYQHGPPVQQWGVGQGSFQPGYQPAYIGTPPQGPPK